METAKAWLVFAGAAVTILAVIGAVCGGGGSSSRPGSPEVYARIGGMTDCGQLQETFDRNMDDAERREPGSELRDVVLSYADAAHDRMSDIGCYDR